MSFFSGVGEMDRKKQGGSTQGRGLPRSDHGKSNVTYQQMSTGFSSSSQQRHTEPAHSLGQGVPYQGHQEMTSHQGHGGSYRGQQEMPSYPRQQGMTSHQGQGASYQGQEMGSSRQQSDQGHYASHPSHAPRTDYSETRQLEEKLRKANDTIESLSRELLSHKLSASMNQQLSQDETSIENISIRNRPMNLVTDYTTFCSTKWHTAKEFLDKQMSRSQDEPEKLRFLSKVMETAEVEANELKGKLLKNLEIVLSQPVTWAGTGKMAGPKADVERSPALFNLFSDHLRETSDNVDMTELQKKICDAVRPKARSIHQFTHFLEDKSGKAYIEACARLAWKMVIQRPPMRLDCSTGVRKPFDDKTQELHWGARDPTKGHVRVEFYVFPALMHGDKLMVKGKVWTE